MTAWASVEVAVEAMRRGAKDFVTKPWDNRACSPSSRTRSSSPAPCAPTAASSRKTRFSAARAAPTSSPSPRPCGPCWRSSPASAPPTPTCSSPAKTAPARASSPRPCTPSPSAPASLHLGQHGRPARGRLRERALRPRPRRVHRRQGDRAGRFELADGGTLFMDEIGNIPMSQQAKILRTLETGEFERVGSSRTYRANVRLISATNSDLTAEVAAGKFRQDLLFRLNTIHLHLPPLRERREDIAAARPAFPEAARRALPQADHRLRRRRARGDARLRVAGQRPRARPLGRARRADGAGQGRPRPRPRAQRRPGRPAPRGHEPRGGRVLPDQEDARPLRRQRPQGRRGTRPEPQRLLPPPREIRDLPPWRPACGRDCAGMDLGRGPLAGGEGHRDAGRGGVLDRLCARPAASRGSPAADDVQPAARAA
jgi:hypothetical protein